MARGKFIVFEGTDGSGKTTQMKLLGEYLRERGVATHLTHEPTASPYGTLLRSCMAGKTDADEHVIALLFAADRIDHIQNAENGMKQLLEQGVTVLCDRYYFSSFAYNGGFVPLEWVVELNRPAMEMLRPDLFIYLDVSPEDAMARIAQRGERERYEDLARQKLIREKYFEVFARFRAQENIVVVKNEAAPEATQAKLRKLCDDLFGGNA